MEFGLSSLGFFDSLNDYKTLSWWSGGIPFLNPSLYTESN